MNITQNPFLDNAASFLMILLESSTVKYLYFCISCFNRISFIMFSISMFYWIIEVTLSFRVVTCEDRIQHPRSYLSASFYYYSHSYYRIRFYCQSFYARQRRALQWAKKRCYQKFSKHPILSSFDYTYFDGAYSYSQSFVSSTVSGRNEYVGLGGTLLILLKVADSRDAFFSG